MNFKPPIESLVSPLPDRLGKISLDSVIEYCAESTEIDIADATSRSDNIKNADPYASDPYDRLIKIKHQVNSLCIELMELQVFTERELNVFFTENDRIALVDRIRTSQFLLESGVLRDFSFTKSYAVRLCREMLELVRYYRKCFYRGYFSLGDARHNAGDDNKGEGNSHQEKKRGNGWILLVDDYFMLLRYIYTNIGKMHALVHYFEQNQIKTEPAGHGSKTPDRFEYQKEVKEIILNLLGERYAIRGEKFKTISSAVKEVKNDFLPCYLLMQKSNVDQQYFDIEHLDRNFKKYLKIDVDYRNSVSQFINLKN
ncbi:MAG: hypothetical protein LBE61_08915 [Burkholderiaceae bacterium]|jgi:hypothetical protein|nr:hypothetical protein [Burkholderiaceae bacterium]